MSEIPDPSPELRLSRWKAVREWNLDRRFKDPVQRASQHHLHDDLTKSATRVQEFLDESEAVRIQVMMELRRRNELNTPGNAAPALSALLGAVAVGATLLGTLVFAIFNGWFATVIKMTDEKTGIVEGLTQQQFEEMMHSVTTLLAGIGVVVLGPSIWAVSHARRKDRVRAVSLVWIEEYTRASAQVISDDVRLPGGGGLLPRVPRLFRGIASPIAREPRVKTSIPAT
jgi:hypothetical protein